MEWFGAQRIPRRTNARARNAGSPTVGESTERGQNNAAQRSQDSPETPAQETRLQYDINGWDEV